MKCNKSENKSETRFGQMTKPFGKGLFGGEGVEGEGVDIIRWLC